MLHNSPVLTVAHMLFIHSLIYLFNGWLSWLAMWAHYTSSEETKLVPLWWEKMYASKHYREEIALGITYSISIRKHSWRSEYLKMGV